MANGLTKITVSVSFIVNYLNINGVAIFIVNFIAIVPLAAMLSYATKEITLRVALVKNEITIIKTSLVSSMLLNLLLILRICFFFKGISRVEHLLALYISSLIIPTGTLITFTISTTLVAFCSKFIVNSISKVTVGGTISITFISLILLLIVGNAAKHVIAVTVACKDKIDLVIGVAIRFSMQITLLILPFVVIIAILFVTVLLINYLIQNSKSHWLKGVLFMATYLIIAVAGWFYPKTALDPLYRTLL
ncbi:hypothetical protein V2W45_1493865 [Cenococcum geophilum]